LWPVYARMYVSHACMYHMYAFVSHVCKEHDVAAKLQICCALKAMKMSICVLHRNLFLASLGISFSKTKK
jgi:hypothetical protein